MKSLALVFVAILIFSAVGVTIANFTNLTGNETLLNLTPENSSTEEKNVTLINNTETNKETNETEQYINQSLVNKTIVIPVNESSDNSSLPSNETKEDNKENIEESTPEVSLDISAPSDITRGEKFSVGITISVKNKNLTNLTAFLSLPNGFSIESEDNECKSIKSGENCTIQFLISSKTSASLGKNDFKVIVEYE